jgi:hypothetical protein
VFRVRTSTVSVVVFFVVTYFIVKLWEDLRKRKKT